MKPLLIFLIFCPFLSFGEIHIKLGSNIKQRYERYLQLYKSNQSISAALSKSGDPVRIYNYKDAQYYGQVCVGNPGQRFTVIFDTGSDLFWVPSASCSSYSCNNKNKYDSSSSKSWTSKGKTISIQYGKGSMEGLLADERVKLGNSTFFMTFAEATKLPGDAFALASFDGIMGMSYPINDYNVLYVLKQQNLIQQTVVSFYLNRDFNGDVGGAMVVGGVNEDFFYSNYTYIPVTNKQQQHWIIKFEGVSVGKSKFPCSHLFSSCHAIPDTGTSFILGPQYDVAQINQLIGARLDNTVNCGSIKTLPNITFGIGGKQFVLEPQDYILQIENLCLSTFMEMPAIGGGIDWILGDAFLGKFYTIFDFGKGQVAFAQLKKNIPLDSIKAIPQTCGGSSSFRASALVIFLVAFINIFNRK